MALLKEDGSLDIERINNLPLEEYMEEMGDLTQEQVKEYVSKLPINESKEPIRALKVNYPMEKDGVDAEEIINKIGKRGMNDLDGSNNEKQYEMKKVKVENSKGEINI